AVVFLRAVLFRAVVFFAAFRRAGRFAVLRRAELLRLRRAGGISFLLLVDSRTNVHFLFHTSDRKTRGTHKKNRTLFLAQKLRSEFVKELRRQFEIIDIDALVRRMNERSCFEQRHRILWKEPIGDAFRERFAEPMTVGKPRQNEWNELDIGAVACRK